MFARPIHAMGVLTALRSNSVTQHDPCESAPMGRFKAIWIATVSTAFASQINASMRADRFHNLS